MLMRYVIFDLLIGLILPSGRLTDTSLLKPCFILFYVLAFYLFGGHATSCPQCHKGRSPGAGVTELLLSAHKGNVAWGGNLKTGGVRRGAAVTVTGEHLGLLSTVSWTVFVVLSASLKNPWDSS